MLELTKYNKEDTHTTRFEGVRKRGGKPKTDGDPGLCSHLTTQNLILSEMASHIVFLVVLWVELRASCLLSIVPVKPLH
jgi:hypothetical protein